MEFRRITVDPRQMGGVSCLRGLRIPVATVVGMVADGMSDEDILQAYPDLKREDIRRRCATRRPLSKSASSPSSRGGEVSDRQRAVSRGGGWLARGGP